MIVNYKYRLYVNKHTKELSELVTSSIYVWNHLVALYRRHYKLFGVNPSLGKVRHHLAKIAKRNAHWSKMGSQSLQELCERVDQTYKMFFKHQGGRPDFHSTRDGGSFVFMQGVGYSLNGNEITINKIGRTYRFKLTRPYENVRRVAIKRDNQGYLWLVVCCDVALKQYNRLGSASIGLDFGLKHFITTSEAEVIDNPQHLKKQLKKVKQASKNLSRKVKGSNSRKKAKRQLAKLHERIANRRADFHWKTAHALCKTYSHIAIEDLNMKAMKKLWGRKVSDLGWSEFVLKLEHVAKKYGTEVVKVDRFAATSQICHCCGYQNKGTKDLRVRQWTCPQCGQVHDRDVNAAINILNFSYGKGVSRGKSGSKTRKTSVNCAAATTTEDSRRL
jgi:putative transposase